MNDIGTNALLRLVESLSIQVGELTKEIGEVKGMLRAWELDRERIDQHREDMHTIKKELAEGIAYNRASIDGVKTRQMTTAIAVIVIGVVSLGNQWPVIFKALL